MTIFLHSELFFVITVSASAVNKANDDLKWLLDPKYRDQVEYDPKSGRVKFFLPSAGLGQDLDEENIHDRNQSDESAGKVLWLLPRFKILCAIQINTVLQI